MRFSSAVRHEPAIHRWFDERDPELASVARPWFNLMRALGDDVRELLHDDHPTACIGDAAFGYVNVFTAHANVGFFLGALLDDPAALLEGTGKRMRHVKLKPGQPVDADALDALVRDAYRDMQERLQRGATQDAAVR